MRAVVADAFGSYEDLTFKEVSDPSPSDGQVHIDVRAVGVTFADLLVIGGKYQSLSSPPFIPGKEVSGEVLAVGKDVSICRPGDRVMALLEDGGYAEQAVASESYCYVIPQGMSFVDAASLMNDYQTAHFALMERAHLRSGEIVLITGAAGGVGLAAVQLAKAKGATVLAGITISTSQFADAKRKFVLENGADHIIDLGCDDLGDSLRQQVYAATDGHGADVVLDPVGGDVFDACLRTLAWCGRIVIIGFVSGRIPEIKANYLLIKNITASGLYLNTYQERDSGWVRRVQEELLGLYRAGKIKSPVMRTLPLENAKEALAMIAGRQVQGRLILTTG